MDAVLKALADPNRRTLLARLGDHDGQTLKELCAGLAMARQSVAKHLAVLEGAGLVTVQRQGRQKLHYVNADPITDLVDELTARWGTTQHSLGGLASVEAGRAAEMYAYVVYIDTTPERLWHAITHPDTSRAYMGHAIESDWLRGSTYIWVDGAGRIEDAEQVILEADPYQRLRFVFPMHASGFAPSTPELDDVAAAVGGEGRTRVSFDIEAGEQHVKLTLVHEGFGPGSIVRALVAHEWPRKLSALKTGLEQLTAP